MDPFSRYMQTLYDVTTATKVTDATGADGVLTVTLEAMGSAMRRAHAAGNKIMFVGNGGSASICSHMAIDYSKNGGIRTTVFNDGAALTCISNDLGYDRVFAEQVLSHAHPGDILVAISSSGRSPNILNAVAAGRERDCVVYTFSGFDADNPLRGLGDLNLHISSHEYGFVEIGHLAVLHAVLDFEMG